MTGNEISEKAEESRRNRRSASRFLCDMEPFIRRVASRYWQSDAFSPYRDDIFTAAQCGLFNAVRSFDFTRGGFIRYAEKAMEIEIRLFLSTETRLIRIPRYVSSGKRKMNMVRRENPGLTDDEVMKRCGIKSRRTYESISSAPGYGSVTSLDREIGDRGGTLLSLLDSGETVQEEFEREERMREMRLLIAGLSESDRFIIVHTYGLYGAEKMKNTSLAEKLSVSRQTVINRRKRSLEYLRKALLPLMT